MISLHVFFVRVMVFLRTQGVRSPVTEFTRIFSYMKQFESTKSEHSESAYIPVTPQPHEGQEQSDVIVVASNANVCSPDY